MTTMKYSNEEKYEIFVKAAHLLTNMADKTAISTGLMARSAIKANRLGNIRKFTGKAVSPDIFRKALVKKRQAGKFMTNAWASKGNVSKVKKVNLFKNEILPGAMKRYNRTIGGNI